MLLVLYDDVVVVAVPSVLDVVSDNRVVAVSFERYHHLWLTVVWKSENDKIGVSIVWIEFPWWNAILMK